MVDIDNRIYALTGLFISYAAEMQGFPSILFSIFQNWTRPLSFEKELLAPSPSEFDITSPAIIGLHQPSSPAYTSFNHSVSSSPARVFFLTIHPLM